MRYERWKLSQQLMIQNELGEYKEDWEEICTIEVNVSTSCYKQIQDGVLYRIFNATGLTNYNKFELYCKYKISNDTREYEVDSFNNNGRYTQLLLKEVV